MSQQTRRKKRVVGIGRENEQTKAKVRADPKKRRDKLQRAQKEAHTEGFYNKLQEITDIKNAPAKSRDNKRLRQLFKEVNGATQLQPEVRRGKAIAQKVAEAMYEDSIYYQIPERRNMYLQDLVEKTKKRVFKLGRAAMWWNRVDDVTKPIERILESYELGHVVFDFMGS
jgi:nicotinamide mononucleotide adenylyltransferase